MHRFEAGCFAEEVIPSVELLKRQPGKARMRRRFTPEEWEAAVAEAQEYYATDPDVQAWESASLQDFVEE